MIIIFTIFVFYHGYFHRFKALSFTWFWS